MPFPREWLGPVEDLVPISTTARGRAADAAEDTSGAAPSASAFWTADAAALHSAVQAPASAVPAPDDGPASPPPSLPDEHRRPAPGWAGRRPRWPRVRVWPAAAVLGLAMVAVIGLLGRLEPRSGRLTTAGVSLGAGHSATPARTRLASTASVDQLDGKRSTYTQLALRAARRQAASLARPRRTLSQTTRAHRTAASRKTRSGRRALRRSHPAARGGPSPAPTTPVQPAPTQTTWTYASSEGATAPAPPSAPTVAPTGAATDATAPPRSASTPRRAASQPTFGNNGTLGPGSSPDS